MGRRLAEIQLPEGATIGAILREDTLVPLDDEVVVQELDHIIIFLIDKRRIPEVEKLFQVTPGFF